MLLHRRSHQRLDLTNKIRGTRSLEALGFSCTNAAPGWYYDGSVYRQAAANTCRFDASGGKTGLLIEEADTNEVLYSSENNAVWTVSNATKAATGTSIINGKTPIKVTATGASGYLEQSVATLGGSDMYHYAIVEVGDGTVADIESVGDSRVRLTFATGAVTQVSGASLRKGAYRVTASGPNGGAVWILYHALAAASTPSVLRYYPDPTGSSKFGYMHHCQGSFNDVHGTSPVVTTTVADQRGAEIITSATVPSWWSNTQTSVIASYERIFETIETAVIFGSSDGTTDNYCLYGVNGSAPNNATTTVVKTPDSALAADAEGLASGQVNKVAFSHKDGFTYASGNGSVSSNAAQTGVPADATRFDIGQGLGALFWLNGRIFSLVIRPIAFSSTELASITS